MNLEKMIFTVVTGAAVILVAGVGVLLTNGQEKEAAKPYAIEEGEPLEKNENTARMMISSFYMDKFLYEEYKGSDKESDRQAAEEAKRRANWTVIAYRNLAINNPDWNGEVPFGIGEELEFIQEGAER